MGYGSESLGEAPYGSKSTLPQIDIDTISEDEEQIFAELVRLRNLVIGASDDEESRDLDLDRLTEIIVDSDDDDQSLIDRLAREVERQLVRDLTTEEREVIRKVVEERDALVKGPLS